VVNRLRKCCVSVSQIKRQPARLVPDQEQRKKSPCLPVPGIPLMQVPPMLAAVIQQADFAEVRKLIACVTGRKGLSR